MFLDGGTFWAPIYQHASILRTFFPNLSKLVAFAATPLVLTPFVRNQMMSPINHTIITIIISIYNIISITIINIIAIIH